MLPKGTTLAGYRIDGLLGQGGMGTVYEATQLSLDRVVALKLLAAHLSEDIQFRERFRREGQVQARLEHAHILTVYEAGETEHGLFIAMRLVRGKTVKDLINARELDVDRTLKILEPVAEALDDAHGIGLIHRDIKPQNVLVGARDHSFLADFGLTKGTTETSLTKTGHFVGTFDYISPEQINGERATAASDIYSLAGVLYECLTGSVPFPKQVEAAVLYAHVADPPPRPTDHRPELPQQLDDVIARAMAKDPAARHSSAGELIREVRGSFASDTRAAIVPTDERRRVEPRPGSPTPPETALKASEPAATGAKDAVPASADPAALGPTARAPRPLPAPPRRQPAARAPRRPPSLPVLAAGALVVVVVAGFLIGRTTSADDPAPQSGASIKAGNLSVRAPASWVSSDRRVKRALGLRNAVSLRPGGASKTGSVTVGTAKASGPALLPAALVNHLDAPAPTPEAVQLGDLEALRYSGLLPAKLPDGTLRLYVAPVTGGVATVACTLPPDAPAGPLTAACDRTAASLELRGDKTKAFPLGPDAAYEKKLNRSIKRLNSATKKGAPKLRGAATPAAQARAAASLRTAYETAATSLRGATTNPQVSGANKKIVAALARLAGDYKRLAAAAGGDKAAAYGTAQYYINRDEKRLRRALRAVAA